MPTTFKCIKNTRLIIHRILISFLTLLVIFIGVPIILVIFGPTCIFRWIVFNLAKRFKPELGKMVTAESVMHNLHSNGSIVLAMVLEGFPSVQKIQKDVEEKMIFAKYTNTDESLYPELRQNITSWMGFYFWKPIKDFKIEDHVSIKDTKEVIKVDGDVGRDIIKELGRKSWSENRAMWEIVILPHIQTDSCSDSNLNHFALLFRWHHSLADGISFLKLIEKTIDPPPIISCKKTSPLHIELTSFPKKVLKALTLTFLSVHDFLDSAIDTGIVGDPLKTNRKIVQYSSSYYSSGLIPMEDFKSLAKRNAVTFNGGMHGSLAGAFRRFKKDSEEDLILDVVLPLPNHPEKLRNHACNGFMRLPSSEASPQKRLKSTQRNFEKLRHSLTPIVLAKLGVLVGCQFPSFLKIFLKSGLNQPRIVFINLRWPITPVKVLGHLCTDFHTHVGSVSGTKFLVLMFATYAGNSKLMVQSDSGILSQNDLKNLIECFTKEVKFLKDSPSEENV